MVSNIENGRDFSKWIEITLLQMRKVTRKLVISPTSSSKKNDMDRACLDQMIQECNFRRKNQGSLLDFLTNLY